MNRPAFRDMNDYGRCFTDSNYWRPYVEEICQRHGLDLRSGMRAGNPGTHPVFLVGGKWVVKLFTNMFGSPVASMAEVEVYRLLNGAGVMTATLVASGSLYEAGELWHWPYIVTTIVPGTSFGEGGPHSYADRVCAAREAARVLKVFHSRPLDARHVGDRAVIMPTWESFGRLLEERREHMLKAIDGVVPARLASEMKDWLSAERVPFDPSLTPHLLHGDLNQDHMMGQRNGLGCWRFTGVIDFGDAKAGDPLYDLVPLHFGLFDTDRALLREFMYAYSPGGDFIRDFISRALDYTLLYEFDMVTSGFGRYPQWREATDLLGWAYMVWDIG